MVSLTYIYHDAFLLTTDSFSAIFDFWCMPEGIAQKPADIISADKPLYVFVSHFHKDHFNPEVFGWAKDLPNVKYIISKDTRRHARKYLNPDSSYRGDLRVDPEKVCVLAPGESYEDSLLKVDAFGSTDIGNSYLLTLPDGRKAFHAGDLNAWVWRDESTDEEIQEALDSFRKEIEPLHRLASVIDIAMFPVDSRIGTGYAEGASIFVSKFDVKYFVPMHFGLGTTPEESLKYLSDAVRFESYANPERGEYVALTGYLSSLMIQD